MWVAVVDPWLLLLLLAACFSPITIVAPPLLLLVAIVVTLASSVAAAPSMSSPSPAATCRALACWCGCQPFRWVHGADDGRCKTDVIRDLVDEDHRPFETFPLLELCLDEDGVEERAPIREDCPGDATADVGREQLTNDVYFLLVEGLGNL
jgi:hypothetical protein